MKVSELLAQKAPPPEEEMCAVSAEILEEVDDDEVEAEEDLEDAIEVVEDSYKFVNDLVTGVLTDTVTMPKELILRLEDLANQQLKFLATHLMMMDDDEEKK